MIDWNATMPLPKRMELIFWKQLQLTAVYIYLEDWQVLLQRVLFINCSWKLFLLPSSKCLCSGGLISHRFAQTGSKAAQLRSGRKAAKTFSKERWVGLIFINSEIWYRAVTLLSQQSRRRGRTAVRTAVNTITAAQQQSPCMAAIGPRLKVFSLHINALWLCVDLCVFFFNWRRRLSDPLSPHQSSAVAAPGVKSAQLRAWRLVI